LFLAMHQVEVTTTAYFENETLVIEGCESGERIEELWGDWDYEYKMIVAPDLVTRLHEF